MLVSTVIPTYNRSRDVVLAVESALAQTWKEQEILVVDDGSKDDTAKVMQRFAAPVRYLPKPNGGVSSARNHGIAQARGEVIAFLDSDDEWRPEKLAAQVELMQARPEVGVILTSIMEMDEHRVDVGLFSRRSTLPRDGRILLDVLRAPQMCPSTAMIRTPIVRAAGGFDQTLKTAEDLDLLLKLSRLTEIAVIDRPLIRYSRAPGTLGSQLRSYRDYVFVIERFLKAHEGEIPAADARDALVKAYLKNATGLAACGDVKGALEIGARAIPHLRTRTDVERLGTLGVQVGRNLASRAAHRVGLR
jgi:glycosyltransferase involved in cell wall biosynthesis